jgi:hypothetical protein
MTMDEFGNAAFMFADSIKSLGMDLSQLLAKGLQLRYTEVGMSGGATGAHGRARQSPADTPHAAYQTAAAGRGRC